MAARQFSNDATQVTCRRCGDWLKTLKDRDGQFALTQGRKRGPEHPLGLCLGAPRHVERASCLHAGASGTTGRGLGTYREAAPPRILGARAVGGTTGVVPSQSLADSTPRHEDPGRRGGTAS